MRRALAWVLLWALGVSLPASAATLEELLEAADGYNLDARMSLEQRRKAAAEFAQSWTALFPTVAAQGGWTRNQYPAEFSPAPGAPTIVITPRDQFDAVVRADLPLLDTTRWFRAASAGALSDAAEARERLTRDNVARQVSSTYYGYAAAQALQESAQRSLKLAEAQQRLQEVRAKAGAATELELLRARAEVQRNMQTLADASALVANTRRSLRTLTGVELMEQVALPEENLQPEALLEQLEGRVEGLPAVRAADKDYLAATQLATAGRLLLLPSVSAFFAERFTNATGFIGQSNSYTLGLAFTWRLDVQSFFGLKAVSSGAEIARLAAEKARLMSRDQVHSDWQRLTAAIEKVGAAKAQVAAAERAAQVARDRYAVGSATQVDVIQAERDLFFAEVSHIQARTELASARVSLRLSAGLPALAAR